MRKLRYTGARGLAQAQVPQLLTAKPGNKPALPGSTALVPTHTVMVCGGSADPTAVATHPPHLHHCVVDGDEVGEQIQVPGGEDESEKDLALPGDAYGQTGTGGYENPGPQAHAHWTSPGKVSPEAEQGSVQAPLLSEGQETPLPTGSVQFLRIRL